VFIFDYLKRTYLITNALNATKRNWTLIEFLFCFVELHFAINPRAESMFVIF